ncbi:MAG TPA: DUF6599 family protein [Terriglobales bacterium]|nr:DUF6599 family protein [Terriglobales bacterium]
MILVLALLSGALLAAAAAATVPPPPPQLPNFDGWQKSASTLTLQPGWGLPRAQAAVMNELGLSSIERAAYRFEGRTIHLQGYRFGDAGGAYGAFTYYRPENFHTFDLGQPHAQAASGDTAILFTRGDWFIRVQMDQLTAMTASQMQALAARLTATAGPTQLPALPFYLPRKGLVPNSLHFVRGPAGFAAACTWLPPDAVGFNKSAEAVIANYDFGTDSDGTEANAQLVLLDLPTPDLARTYLAQLERLAGGTAFRVRRSGPLLALVHTTGASSSQAGGLLQAVNWDAEITMVPPVPESLGALPALILGIFVLCGLIMGVAVVVGLLSGALWAWADKLLPRRFQHPEREALISLHLGARAGEKFRPDPGNAG